MPFPIDFDQPTLWYEIAIIISGPLLWNVAARAEYYDKFVSRKIFAGETPRFASLYFSVMMFTLEFARNVFFLHKAMNDQPASTFMLRSPTVLLLANIFGWTGRLLVCSSVYILGWDGAYFGDCFGFITREEKVTAFPYSITSAPMYWGSTLQFLGCCLFYGKPAGLFLSLLVGLCYAVALRWEDPLTDEIYSRKKLEAAEARQRQESQGAGKSRQRCGKGKQRIVGNGAVQVNGSTEERQSEPKMSPNNTKRNKRGLKKKFQ